MTIVTVRLVVKLRSSECKRTARCVAKNVQVSYLEARLYLEDFVEISPLGSYFGKMLGAMITSFKFGSMTSKFSDLEYL